MCRLLVICVLSMLSGCATTRQQREQIQAAPVAPDSTVVFVANGAGDFRAASQSLSEVVAETAPPLHLETVDWSRGYRRVVADQVDRDNHLTQGRRLAGAVTAYRQANPDRRICLVGHSAGSAVILHAAETLPANSIDRIVFLSPSVCTGHDLRPALQASREGIDLFYSKKDRWVLGLGMRILGTTDPHCRVAAGRVGFRSVISNADDAALYAKLRQHSWDRSVRWTGHNGRHFGSIEPEFLRAYVLPLIAGNCPPNGGSVLK